MYIPLAFGLLGVTDLAVHDVEPCKWAPDLGLAGGWKAVLPDLSVVRPVVLEVRDGAIHNIEELWASFAPVVRGVNKRE